jgi:sigma-B regulation protein RsbU (phosphoserine phosphatase)
MMMSPISETFFQEQLQVRRTRLLEAIEYSAQDAGLAGLLQQVDSALERLRHGVFGMCELCDGGIEADRLMSDPLIRVCLDHLTPNQARALEADLHLAGQLQRKLLPPANFHANGWHVHHHYQPAGIVSGDYCDLIEPENSNGEIFFLIGDVSGKGVAASMMMTQLHGMFRSLVSAGASVSRLMETANRVVSESALAGQYATLIAGRACPAGGVELTGAGHLPALLVGGECIKLFPADGLPLGMFCGSTYGSTKLQLNEGQTLVLYTDGLSEARDGGGIEYGEARLMEFFRTKKSLGAEALTAACLEDWKAFSLSATRTDDLTLMMLQRTA